jgi:ankyrin repeat protein
MWVLEHDEEVFRLVAHHLDVGLLDAELRAEGLLDAFRVGGVSVPAQACDYGVRRQTRQLLIHGAIGSHHR